MNAGRSALRTALAQASSSRTAILGTTSPFPGRYVQPVASSSRAAVMQTRSLYNPFQSIPFFRRKKVADSRLAASEPEYYQPPTPASTSSSPEGSEQVVKSEGADGLSTSDIFDQAGGAMEELREEANRGKWKEHKYSTARFKASPRKLNMLSRQIAALPIDEAILQMGFSEKRNAGRIGSTLKLARDHAVEKGLKAEKLVVAETWVSKGKFIKRIDIKGRARHGIKAHGQARLHVVLREGKTKLELLEKKRADLLSKVRSAGVVREDRVLINAPTSGWRW